MRFLMVVLATVSLSIQAFAGDRSILLVTPNGVYQADVVSGVPGPWKPANVDVIVQGFSTKPPGDPPNNGGGDVPKPPTDDPLVLQISSFAKSLKDKTEATACAALINTVDKRGVTGNEYKEVLEMAAPIIDSQLRAEGRIVAFFKSALAVSTDAQKLKAGVVSAWAIDPSVLQQIHEGASDGKMPELPAGTDPQEAFNVALIIQIIQIIQTIIELMTKLGVGQ